jgi:hypothetical protein
VPRGDNGGGNRGCRLATRRRAVFPPIGSGLSQRFLNSCRTARDLIRRLFGCGGRQTPSPSFGETRLGLVTVNVRQSLLECFLWSRVLEQVRPEFHRAYSNPIEADSQGS